MLGVTTVQGAPFGPINQMGHFQPSMTPSVLTNMRPEGAFATAGIGESSFVGATTTIDPKRLPTSKTPQEPDRSQYSGFQKFVRNYGYYAIWGSATAASTALITAGVDPVLAIGANTAIAAPLAYAAEKFIPARDDWKIEWKDLPLDFLNNVFATAGSPQGLQAIIGASLVALQTQGVIENQTFGWLNDAPTAGTALLGAAVLASLATAPLTWFLHWAAHKKPLWFYHGVHHSSDKMNLNRAGFNNWIDGLKYTVGEWMPLFFMGAPSELIALSLAITTANGFLQHSNADFDLGKAEYIVSGVKAHRWHHAVDERRDTNYGITWTYPDTLTGLPYWTLKGIQQYINPDLKVNSAYQKWVDRTYRWKTIYLPEDQDWPNEVGAPLEFTDYENRGVLRQFWDLSMQPIAMNAKWFKDILFRKNSE